MQKFISAPFLVTAPGSAPVLADKVDVEITDLTNAISLTPLLAAARNADTRLFQLDTLGVPGISADPGGNCGAGATGVITTEYNHTVLIHRGIVGNTDPTVGASDLD